ncbi:acyl-CoA dehydrogenase [Mycolicibacter hiberniae]|uniref:Acyl-CoA dehydrogenase n=2 Tax=Mycolicibacter hiberniae TaxID=29314 RepID=A0A7I7X357_9MYCO|nr:hypothetical protein AWC09_09830 [Mycolicibacter hiberniae]BBZ24289.1 acyl-CoA dehydrogenase [Mycolicibacter hiberniae]
MPLMTSLEIFGFTAEHAALREVLREYFAATATTARPDRWRRLLTEVGVDDLLFGETCSTSVELAILAEESGAALFDGPLVSAAAVGPLAQQPALTGVGEGRRAPCVAVSLTGFGDGQTDAYWDYSDDAVVVTQQAVAGETGVAVYGADAIGLQECSGLDLSRPVGRAAQANGQPLLECGVEVAAAMRRRADLVLSAELLGVAQRVLDGTVDYVSRRVQFGRTIGSFQAVKHRLADMLAQVELTRSAVYGAAWQLGDGPVTVQAEVDLAVAAALARQTAVEATKAAVQLHGGIGITWEHWAHRYLRRAHAVIALTGAASRHRGRLAGLIDSRDGGR